MNTKTHLITTYWGFSYQHYETHFEKRYISQVYVFNSKYIPIFLEMYINLSHAQDLETIFSLNTGM